MHIFVLPSASPAQAELDASVLTQLAHNAGAELSPMAALFGGLVAQEVLKAVSGKVGAWLGGKVGVGGTKVCVWAGKVGMCGISLGRC